MLNQQKGTSLHPIYMLYYADVDDVRFLRKAHTVFSSGTLSQLSYPNNILKLSISRI
jgi:hypothetical protein